MRTVVVVLLCSMSIAHAADVAPTNTPSFFPADAARGKARATQCLACHGIANLKLGSPAVQVPMLNGQRPEAIFLALRDYKNGTRSNVIMAPIVAALSEQDMRDVSAYLAAKGPQMPGTHDVGSWAHKKVHRDCTACHGESGMGVMPGIPVLTGQHVDYLIQALDAYRDGTRKNATMAMIAAKLSADESRKLAEYFAMHKHLELSK